MRPLAKKAWVEALRSGEYQQGRARLCTSDGAMCCLGVLVDVTQDGWWEQHEPGAPGHGSWWFRSARQAQGSWSCDLSLPESLLKKLGMDHADQNLLVGMNDGGSTFTTIADWIEEHL